MKSTFMSVWIVCYGGPTINPIGFSLPMVDMSLSTYWTLLVTPFTQLGAMLKVMGVCTYMGQTVRTSMVDPD